MSPDKVREIPSKCSTGHDWFLAEKVATVLPPLETLTDSLARLRAILSQKALGFKILLEFEEPKGLAS